MEAQLVRRVVRSEKGVRQWESGRVSPWAGGHDEVNAPLENMRAGRIRDQRMGSMMSRFLR